jgi:hypothetical protein
MQIAGLKIYALPLLLDVKIHGEQAVSGPTQKWTQLCVSVMSILLATQM